MITAKHFIGVLAAVLLIAASGRAADVSVFNGDFETLNDSGKPAGWVNMGVADGFGSTTWLVDSDNRVGFLADGQLIYLDIEASQLQLGHRLTVAFDAVKDPQSGPATLLVQLVYRDAEGVLNYAGKQAGRRPMSWSGTTTRTSTSRCATTAMATCPRCCVRRTTGT